MDHKEHKAKAVPATDDRQAQAGLLLASLVVVFAMIGIVLAGLSGVVFVIELVLAFAAGYLLRGMRR
jgi:zinc transporter ZupT